MSKSSDETESHEVYDTKTCNTPCSASSTLSELEDDKPLSSLTRTSTRATAKAANDENLELPYLTITHPTRNTARSEHPSFEVAFGHDDPENPLNWPTWYKAYTIGAMSFASCVVILFSTSYTSGMPGMMAEFHVTNKPVATLGVTFYLLGLSVGSLILAPFSEVFGRRPVYSVAMGIFCILVLPCALAKNLETVLVARFFAAVVGSAMMANSPGTVADISSPTYRALCFSIWSLGPMSGPVLGPIIGGFAYQYLGWRWTNWIVMILAGLAWLMVSSVRESYAPVVLKRKAAKIRAATGEDQWKSRYDEPVPVLRLLSTNLQRPFVLTFTEPILWFWDLYVAVCYATYYLCFVAYPIIFRDIRGWSASMSGLAFSGMGVGTVLAIASEPLARRLINRYPREPHSGRVAPEACVSIVCIAAVLTPLGQLWFTWTATPTSIHWIWSILSGIPFAAGQTLIFIYANSYIASSYGLYSASALCGNLVVRSVVGGTLILAGQKMYQTMSPHWAGTLIGLVQVVCIAIPIAFYRLGRTIRLRSPALQELLAEQRIAHNDDEEKGASPRSQ
ncbi:putative benomyl resistance protein-2 [Coleophoma crateriformis]|uniref:Putative benomyl resistance protein-2 n=1 Tax=Coleophoma crateriformis TaxID=565419 RepID=A0A3D8RJP1_9HELO|nr:putative benomyl resistance protein-2 [Coleophoma crateriformis]